jgi:hypothetical protein
MRMQIGSSVSKLAMRRDDTWSTQAIIWGALSNTMQNPFSLVPTVHSSHDWKEIREWRWTGGILANLNTLTNIDMFCTTGIVLAVCC